tara:strand:+ start:1289 stop:1462 length:174 start_codon:yes stop_codon:yes gene_type:complete
MILTSVLIETMMIVKDQLLKNIEGIIRKIDFHNGEIQAFFASWPAASGSGTWFSVGY